jgi:hypothetical protein
MVSAGRSPAAPARAARSTAAWAPARIIWQLPGWTLSAAAGDRRLTTPRCRHEGRCLLTGVAWSPRSAPPAPGGGGRAAFSALRRPAGRSTCLRSRRGCRCASAPPAWRCAVIGDRHRVNASSSLHHTAVWLADRYEAWWRGAAGGCSASSVRAVDQDRRSGRRRPVNGGVRPPAGACGRSRTGAGPTTCCQSTMRPRLVPVEMKTFIGGNATAPS